MFEKEKTLQGYFDRMHQSIQVIIKDVMQDATAHMEYSDLSLVWKGWVKQDVMKLMFKDLYNPDMVPNQVVVIEPNGKDEGKCLYGRWKFDFMWNLEVGIEHDLNDFIDMVKRFIPANANWVMVKEAMLKIHEVDGWAEGMIAIRGIMVVDDEGLSPVVLNR